MPACSEAPPTCRAAPKIVLGSSVAEVRAKLPISVSVADAGNSTEARPVKVVLKKDGNAVKTLLDDPNAALGTLTVDYTPEPDFATGAYEVSVTEGCPASVGDATPTEAKATLYVARLGATKVGVGGGDGATVPLMYHMLNGRSFGYFPVPDTLSGTSLAHVDGEPDLDKADGTARVFPAGPWEDLATPPTDDKGAVLESGNTLPVSLTVGTKPDLLFTIGKTAHGKGGNQPTGLATSGMPPVRLVVDGTPPSDAALVTEGGAVTIRLATSPVPAINVVDLPVKWHFEAKGADGQFALIAGSESGAVMRFYGVLGNDQGTKSPNLPWVAVVDEATRAIAGGATDAATARALLVKHIYEDSGLAYDRRNGASVYTNYTGGGGGWTSASFNLTAYLARSKGKIVNCTDCASILSTFANMVGAKLHYAIIGWDFKLNAIQGIGSTSFGAPFDSGYRGFSYHAVTTPDAAATIDDATLAVDGDDDPKNAPYVKKLVQNLTGDDYLTRLSPTFGTSTPKYQYNDQITAVR